MSHIPRSALSLERALLATFSDHGNRHACHVLSMGIQGERQKRQFGDDFWPSSFISVRARKTWRLIVLAIGVTALKNNYCFLGDYFAF